MKKQISIPIMVISIIFTIMISGCTSINTDLTDNTPATATAPTAALTEKPVEAKAEPQKPSQLEDLKPSVSWKDFYPNYNEQTKQKLIESAKDEIVRVFPDVDRSKLEGSWLDHQYTYSTGTYGLPVIKFTNVDDTSDKYITIYGSKNIVQILVDPSTNEIINYKPAGYSSPSSGIDKSLTFDEGIQRSENMLKKIKGESYIDENSANLIVDKRDNYDNYRGGLITYSIYSKYKGIPYLGNGISVMYNAYADKLSRYSNSMTNPDLLNVLTTLSPVPDVSLTEAKKIFETRLAEEYPGEDLELNYVPLDSYRYGDSLIWFNDYSRYVFADDPKPIPLTWYLQFNDKEMREENPNKRQAVFVDAHTGEIVSLIYRDIRIPEQDS
ncbi:hypothetical protein F1737_05875 [Methanoplanus sp. FWC-SCC4]|uniref:Uncharacterized protein n=1 Tax=Methanochimaera problematica TaxID=2609417 RepID=A0AA97FCC4_9EURY|nr:hypothetical protein [Methanoplanus sp. FWC-SCC4]WOF16272.1 hypothetical protein F1737_05875 [Methanoplanus sp. FWC-SCC4]